MGIVYHQHPDGPSGQGHNPQMSVCRTISEGDTNQPGRPDQRGRVEAGRVERRLDQEGEPTRGRDPWQLIVPAEPLPTPMGPGAVAQSGPPQPSHQFTTVHGYRPVIDRPEAVDGIYVVVIALESDPAQPQPVGEPMELLEGVVADEVGPALSPPWPDGGVDQDRHSARGGVACTPTGYRHTYRGPGGRPRSPPPQHHPHEGGGR